MRRAARDIGPAEVGTPPSPGPDDAARVQALLCEVHVWLLAGYAADAVIRAAAIAEIALRVLAGRRPDAGAELGGLIDELERGGRTELVADARWLDQLRIATEPLAGQVRADRDAEGRRACEIAIRFAVAAGLVTAPEAAAAETSAAWQASAPAPGALLRLDRATHRKALDDLLAQPSRVLVVLVHGEVGQGHDHFAEIMTWRLRSAASGRWREVVVAWPPPSRSLGTRLAMLLDALGTSLGVALSAPVDGPATPDASASRGRFRALDRRPSLCRITGQFPRESVPSHAGDTRGTSAFCSAASCRDPERPGQGSERGTGRVYIAVRRSA